MRRKISETIVLSISVKMPLRELMRNFFDELKSVSSGYGSISYEMDEMREANVTRLDILVADEVVPAFSRVIAKKRAEEEAEKAVIKLESLLPRQMFTLKIQGKALGTYYFFPHSFRHEKRCHPAYVWRRYYPQNETSRKTKEREKENERARKGKYSARCISENDACRERLIYFGLKMTGYKAKSCRLPLRWKLPSK